MKRLKRSTENKIIFGVCSGLANFLNIDATLVRIVFLLFLLSSFFTAFLIYLACSLIIPADTKIIYQESGNNGKNNSHLFIGIFLIILGLILLAKTYLPWFNYSIIIKIRSLLSKFVRLWPILLIVLGVYILTQKD